MTIRVPSVVRLRIFARVSSTILEQNTERYPVRTCSFSTSRCLKLVAAILALFITLIDPAFGQIRKFVPNEGDMIEMWKITDDPTVRDWANYHNAQCWNVDGRYLCYVHFAAKENEFGHRDAAEIHLYDFLTKADIKIDQGTNPRWANNHNWLFYAKVKPGTGRGSDRESGAEVFWYDVDKKTTVKLCDGVADLKEVDYQDQYLYALKNDAKGKPAPVRMKIMKNAQIEVLPHEEGYEFEWFSLNPKHPVIVSRDMRYKDFNYATPGTQDIPFTARRFSRSDLDGTNATKAYPTLDGSHFSWSGDGTYFLLGNGILRGVQWNDFLPGNIHFLSPMRCGDVCRAGTSGRWITGSVYNGRGPQFVADLRSGDGWIAAKTYSVFCFPGTEDNSGIYDVDGKGSPDATKIVFVSNYDLEHGPGAEITEDGDKDRIVVNSTKGFPAKGRIVMVTGFAREVLGYDSLTPTSFEKLTRGLYGTPLSAAERGQDISLFDYRLIPEKLWKNLPKPDRRTLEIVGDPNSPLLKQRSTDIYAAVVRLPDRPLLRQGKNGIELIPGENHLETFGYHIALNGKRITQSPLRPGKSMTLSKPGEYTAVAVEWSGLESKPGHAVRIEAACTLLALEDQPADFSWTADVWYVANQKTSERTASLSRDAVKDIVHVYDGVIHREWYNWGQIAKRFDYNKDGKPIRQQYYQTGRLARRELHNREGVHISTEFFDRDGNITEAFHNPVGGGKSYAYVHYWYENREPVKAVKGDEMFVKVGDKWVKQ